MSEFRELFAKHLGHRVKVRGVVSQLRIDHKGSRACIAEPEMDGQVVSSHVWVMPITQELQEAEGALAEFEAVVRDYNNGFGRNYCLKNPDKVTIVSRPALRVPRSQLREDVTAIQERIPCAPGSADTQNNDVLADLLKTKAFIKVCGSYKQAIAMLRAVPPDVPIEVLTKYAEVLNDE